MSGNNVSMPKKREISRIPRAEYSTSHSITFCLSIFLFALRHLLPYSSQIIFNSCTLHLDNLRYTRTIRAKPSRPFWMIRQSTLVSFRQPLTPSHLEQRRTLPALNQRTKWVFTPSTHERSRYDLTHRHFNDTSWARKARSTQQSHGHRYRCLAWPCALFTSKPHQPSDEHRHFHRTKCAAVLCSTIESRSILLCPGHHSLLFRTS